MKIVVTDGYTLNPGDLSWDSFSAFGELVYYDRTPVQEVASRCADATVIVTNKTPIDAATIAAAKNLKLIAVTATGYNIVDVAAARAAGVDVCNVPLYGTDSVAQHAIAMLLELTNQVGLHAKSVREGEWARSADFAYVKAPVIELRDKWLGIVGMGRIGRQTALIAKALGMRIAYARTPRKTDDAVDVTREEEGATLMGLGELFAHCDVISLHCPLTEANKAFVNAALLRRMKRTAFLINTSRGALIHETELAEALRSGILAGAALDVLSVEPPPADHPLTGLSNCIVTPHIAWISFEARQRIMQTTVDNMAAALAGRPIHLVN